MSVLDRRALNRALLARQLLLQRHDMPVADAVEHLVGLQAQEPLEPYVGLWSRLAGFQPSALVELLLSRRAVRTLLMRRTLHLVTARDCVALRPVHQAMLVSRMWSTLRRALPGVDLDELTKLGRPLFEQRPRMLTEAARAIADRWPGVEPRSLGDALSTLLPLVQVPPRGVWGERGAAYNTTIETWLGRPLEPTSPATVDALVLRYLAAYGPAATADLRAWSGLSGLRESVHRLRPSLRTFRDERGRELLDVPDGALPDPQTPAPPRFLPAFDNAVLGYDDRSRVIDAEHRGLSVTGARFLLVDGRVSGTWAVTVDDGAATLRITPLRALTTDERDAVLTEGDSLLAMFEPEPRNPNTVSITDV
ncbi:Winged helix DNA-binding domain-containing protein [Micromonospora phaseoli]|uniref:Winged helix DNA-binding domain-containing protein n=1 Tax=Micromonospora phaseoli TaxID=1144548 RepID=A0A1H7CB76_9ACTN|nr:winged helix DNA-binding domain-containing protein [Micromonospora phaseoli]PZV92653.1 winged helix DNA-binding protein [Micromonospora phaseoli]SEJ83870.1 Winged helix DNA-binding domain-containing protein [Micromonospora phaseoli]